MSRELGLPLRFPGLQEGWNSLQEACDAELFGRATLVGARFGEREEREAHVTNQVVGPFQPPADLFSWPFGLLHLIPSELTSWTSRSLT